MLRMLAMTEAISCPWCGTAKHVYPHGERECWCSRCRRLFDADVDEGGDWSDRNPTARLEREERRKKARRNHGGR